MDDNGLLVCQNRSLTNVRNTKDRVAVASRSFSTNPVLRAELLERY